MARKALANYQFKKKKKQVKKLVTILVNFLKDLKVFKEANGTTKVKNLVLLL